MAGFTPGQMPKEHQHQSKMHETGLANDFQESFLDKIELLLELRIAELRDIRVRPGVWISALVIACGSASSYRREAISCPAW